MIVGAFFILSSFLFGIACSNFLKFLDDWHKRIAFAAGFGFLVSTYLTFLISWAFGTLSEFSILFTGVLLLGFFVRFYKHKKLHLSNDIVYSIALLVIFGILIYLNLHLLPHMTKDGIMVAGGNIWGDYPFHLGVIHSFSERANFPPKYPILITADLAYPFMINFLSAILVKGGYTLFQSLLFPHAIFYFSLISFLFYLGEYLGRRKIVGLLLVILFLFNGNWGFYYAIGDALKTPDALNYLQHPATAYSHIDPIKGNHVGKDNIEFMNMLFSVLIPQRAAIMGTALAVLFFFLLFIGFKRQERVIFLFAGIILGLLPLSHGHSFLVAAGFAAFAFFYAIFTSPKKHETLKLWLYLIVPALLLSAPQLLFMRSQLGDADFIKQRPGWMQEPAISVQDWAVFWFRNWGLILPLAIIGFALSPNFVRILFIPFVLIFLAGNYYKLSPWDWDTIKIFVPGFIFICYFAALALEKLSTSKKWFLKYSAIILLFLSIFSGILTLFWWHEDLPTLYSKRDFIMADWVKRSTPPDAVWITSDAHNHVIPSLTGRQAVLGLKWYLYSHGLEKKKIPVERDINNYFQTADCAIANKYGADFVYLGIQEERIEHANRAAFTNNPNYEPIFDQDVEGYRTTVYKINC